MAVTVDSVDSATGHVASTSPMTFAFNNAAGTKLIVGVSISQSNPDGTPSVSGITYPTTTSGGIGQALTLLDSYITGTPIIGDDEVLYYWYLDSPATGSNNIVISFSFSGGPTNKDALAGAISFTGAASGSSGFGTTVKNKETTVGNTTTATASVTGTTSGNIVLGLMNTGSGAIVVSAPATKIWTLNNSTHTGGDNASMSYTSSSGGTVTPTFTFTADIWSEMAVEVKAPSLGDTQEWRGSYPPNRRTWTPNICY